MTIPPRSLDPPVLCYDRSPSKDDPGWRFRSTSDLGQLRTDTNQTGMTELRLSGSGSLSKPDHMEQIKKAAGTAPVTVVDLREESHAIVGEYPVTWFGHNGWANVGLSHDQVQEDEQQRIAALKNEPQIVLTRHHDWKHGVTPPRTATPNERQIQSEQELVEGAGGSYVRIGVSDHVRPTDQQVDGFINLVRGLPEESALHVHCKAGMGRTTTFMVMYDMLRNAHVVGMDDIIKRQSELGFGYDVLNGDPQPDLSIYHQDRKEFIHAFHAYAQHNPGGSPMNWSEWQARPPEPAPAERPA